MRIRYALVTLALVLAGLAAEPLRAAPVQVFVNNRTFEGRTAPRPGDTLLEAEVLFRMIGQRWEPGAPTAILEGTPVGLEERDGVAMVSARQVAQALGGRYQENPATASVDLYAYDVLASTVRTRQGVLEKARIETDADLQVLDWTVRQILDEDLGLAFRTAPAVRLGDDRRLAAAGIARDSMGGLVYGLDAEPSRITFLVREGTNPLSAMTTLAWNWGTAWAAEQGLPVRDPRAQGFGLWASYNLLQRLDASPPAGAYGTWQGSEAHAVFLQLLAVQGEGGPVAVLERARQGW